MEEEIQGGFQGCGVEGAGYAEARLVIRVCMYKILQGMETGVYIRHDCPRQLRIKARLGRNRSEYFSVRVLFSVEREPRDISIRV